MRCPRCLCLCLLMIYVTLIAPGCTASVTPTYPSAFAVTPPYLTKDMRTATRMTIPSPARTLPTSVPSLAPLPLSTVTPVSSRVTLPTVTASTASTTPEAPIAKLPPPLAAVSFPAQVIAYPPDWHPDLRYPDQFHLVEVSVGVSPQGSKGWGAKLVFQGDPKNAADLFAIFLASKGWQVVERTELDSKGFLLIVQKGDKQHAGTIVIDPDTQRPGYIKIIATVFP